MRANPNYMVSERNFYKEFRKRIEQYLFLQSGVSKRKIHTKIIDTSGEVFQTSKGLLNWAEIKNMQEVSRLINFLSTQHIQSETDPEPWKRFQRYALLCRIVRLVRMIVPESLFQKLKRLKTA